MEVIEIGKSQVILVLDRDDMLKYSISTEENSPLLRDGFCRMVNDLGMGSRFMNGVLVQIFDSKNGGCEMFVTKLADNIREFDGKPDIKRKYIYIFQKLDDMLSACRMLSESRINGGSAFKGVDKGPYYLLLDFEYPYLSEFGARYLRDTKEEFLAEHCSLISSSAVESLSALA
ncbi:MAG: hypothetical protein IJD22_04190 [Clostridia bacterium]|nr:hypothetical protein [Clostridia bacterium]